MNTVRRSSKLPSVLIAGVWVSAAVLAVAGVGLLADHRTISGAPAWLKPAKFGASALVYTLSLAFMTRDLPPTRWLRFAWWATTLMLAGELAAICMQAARGTTSHFNIDSPFDVAIYSSMGVGIATAWLASAIILWQHLRFPAPDRALALALRLGLALNILGAGIGWTMTRPFPGQVEAISRGERPRVAGRHTVGAPDGGAGLPVTRWSTTHGDLRVPHFIGMHALQLLPLLVLLMRRVRSTQNEATARIVLYGATAAYVALVALTLQRALADIPLIAATGS